MVLQGILLGISLSFLLGPLFFAVIHAGIERGFRAGVALAGGIWTGDVLFVLAILYGLESFAAFTALPGFHFWAGIAGGGMLLVFGFVGLRNHKIKTEDLEDTVGDRLLDRLDGQESAGGEHKWKAWGLIGYWLRGFLINLINPGTIFFWLSIATGVIIPNGWSDAEILRFFSGMLITLVVTDTLKAYAAKRLRNWLSPGHTRRLGQGISMILIIFGIILIIRLF